MTVLGRNVGWLQFDPFRRPAWRWDAAQKIAGGDLPYRREDDATKAAVAYLRRHELADAGRHRRRSPHDAAIGAALELHKGGGPVAWELQARIAAIEPSETIAAKCQLPVDVARYFESLFFDARAANPWTGISARTADPAADGSSGGADVQRMWLWAAMSGGPHAVDAFVQAYRAAHRPGEPHSLGAYLRQGAPVELALQALVASHVLPRSLAVEKSLVELRLRLIEVQMRRSSDGTAQSRDAIARDLVAMARAVLEGKPTTLRPPVRPTATPKRETPSDGRVEPWLDGESGQPLVSMADVDRSGAPAGA